MTNSIVEEFCLVDGIGAQLYRRIFGMCYAKRNGLPFKSVPFTDFLVHESDRVTSEIDKKEILDFFNSFLINPWSVFDFNQDCTVCPHVGAGTPESQGVIPGLHDFTKEGPSFNPIEGSTNSIVIHIRRGNVISSNPRWIDEDLYVRFLENIDDLISELGLVDPDIIVLTDAPDHEIKYKPIDELQRSMWNQDHLVPDSDGFFPTTTLDFEKIKMACPRVKIFNKLSTIESFILMVRAGVLVTSSSAFSQSAGLLSKNKVLDFTNISNVFANSVGVINREGRLVRHKASDPGTIFYRLHHAGLFNKLMSLEIALGLSEVTGKALVLYNSMEDTEKPIDTPSLTEGLDLGKRSSILRDKIPSLFDLIDYPEHLIKEKINLKEVSKFFSNEVVISGKSLHDRYVVVSDTGNKKDFGVNRDELAIIPGETYHFKTYTLAAYSRFFFGRSKELDRILASIKFKQEYVNFAKMVADFLGDFNGIHLRLGDHKQNYNVSEKDFADAVVDLSSKKVVVLTDEVRNPMLLNKDIILLDDVIVDNFSAEFSLLPNRSEVAYGLVCALVMTYSNDFIGTLGSTFSNYIYRERLQQKHIRFKYLGVPEEEHGQPFSWNTKTLEGYGSISREWPESKLNL